MERINKYVKKDKKNKTAKKDLADK